LKDRQWDFAVKLITVIMLVVAIIWFIQRISWVIGLLLISLLIVYSIYPISSYLHKKGVPHLISVFSVFFSSVIYLPPYFLPDYTHPNRRDARTGPLPGN
jgi:predicted PurR-regulated permease PerM